MKNWSWIGCVTLMGLPLALAGCSDLGGNPGLGGVKSQKQAASSPYQRGKQQFAAGNYGLAAKHFQQAVGRDGSSIEALNGLAAAYDKMGRFDLAERYYRQALVVDPQSAQSLNNLGYSYLLQGKYDLALAYLRDAQALGQDNPVILANRDFADASLQSSAVAKVPDEAAASARQAPVVASARLKVERASSTVQTLKTEAEPQPSIDAVVQQFAVPAHLDSSTPAGANLAESPKRGALQPAPPAVPVGEVVQVALLTPLPTAGDTEMTVFDFDDEVSLTAIGTESDSGLLAQPNPAMSPERGELQPAMPVEEVVQVALLTPTMADGIEATQFDFDEEAFLPSPGAEPGSDLMAVQQFAVPADPKFAIRVRSDLVETSKDDALRPSMAAGEVVQIALLTPQTTAYDSGVAAFDFEDEAFIVSPGPEFGSSRAVSLVEVTNGAGRNKMAARMRGYLGDQGVKVTWLTNAEQFGHDQSTIFYQEGWRSQAEALAATLPVSVTFEPAKGQRAQLRLRIGWDLFEFDSDLQTQVQRVSDDTQS